MINHLETLKCVKIKHFNCEFEGNFGKYYTDAFRASFREAVEGTRAELGEFPLQSVALDQGLMQADGIHPTEAAQPLIMESVWQTLQSLL